MTTNKKTSTPESAYSLEKLSPEKLRYKEDVDRILSYLSLHGIEFTFEQFEDVSRLLCRCQGSGFLPESMAGLLVIIRYSLRQKSLNTASNSLEYHLDTIRATHNIEPDRFQGIIKLYEIFQAARHNQDLTNVTLPIEFKYQLAHLAEFFTKPSSNEKKEETL